MRFAFGCVGFFWISRIDCFLKDLAIQILVGVGIGGVVSLWVLMLFSGVLIVFGVCRFA